MSLRDRRKRRPHPAIRQISSSTAQASSSTTGRRPSSVLVAPPTLRRRNAKVRGCEAGRGKGSITTSQAEPSGALHRYGNLCRWCLHAQADPEVPKPYVEEGDATTAPRPEPSGGWDILDPARTEEADLQAAIARLSKRRISPARGSIT